jgi:hypothetical protein
MYAVLDWARRAGAKYVGVQASDDGLGVYRRLGFFEVCTFRVYSSRHRFA